MDTPLSRLATALHSAPALLVQVERTEGSAPREAGAWMAVLAPGGGHDTEQIGSVGGGHLELDAMAHARRLLADPALLPALRGLRDAPPPDDPERFQEAIERAIVACSTTAPADRP